MHQIQNKYTLILFYSFIFYDSHIKWLKYSFSYKIFRCMFRPIFRSRVVLQYPHNFLGSSVLQYPHHTKCALLSKQFPQIKCASISTPFLHIKCTSISTPYQVCFNIHTISVKVVKYSQLTFNVHEF